MVIQNGNFKTFFLRHILDRKLLHKGKHNKYYDCKAVNIYVNSEISCSEYRHVVIVESAVHVI